jgi:hypothetical protein
VFGENTVVDGDKTLYAHWIGISEVKVQYGSMTTKLASGLSGTIKDYTVALPIFVVLDSSSSNDTVKASLTATSTVGTPTVTPSSNVLTSFTGGNSGNKATFTVTSPTTGKNYTYTVAVSKKTAAATLMAAGGQTIKFLATETGENRYWDEVHIFTTTGSQTLAFTSGRWTSSLTGDVLIVGGGGGSGGDANANNGADFAGGGGAGGLLYKTGQTIPQPSTVVVGSGGDGGTVRKQGANGTHSRFDSLYAPGGGGGGSAQVEVGSMLQGLPGGSGGGGGASGKDYGQGRGGDGNTNTSSESTVTIDSGLLGNSGGNGGYADKTDAGGGGGGASGAGDNASGTYHETPGAGGAGWTASSNGASWIQTAVGTATYSRGGDGGGSGKTAKTGDYYGDGGFAGGNTIKSGGAGHSGIVVVRFRFSE